MKNWLITGGCGFIGTSLVSALLRSNQAKSIRILDNLSVGSRDDLSEVCSFIEKKSSSKDGGAGAPVELIIGDIKDYADCLSCCKDIDVVVHLAANTGVAPSVENPRSDMEANVIGIFNMLEASRQSGVKGFIFASSGAPLGEVEPPIHEKIAPSPVSPYGASKLAGEGYCSAFYRTFGLKTIALRFGNVYGPRSKHKSSVIAKFIRQALNGEGLDVYGDGTQTRDFIYIDDLIQAVMLSVRADKGGEVFQIATYKETTVNEIAEKIRDLIEGITGNRVAITYSSPRLGDVKRNYSDISKAKSMLGYAPQFDLDAGLKRTLEYFMTLKKHQ